MLVAPEIYTMFAKAAFETGAKNLSGVSGLKESLQWDSLVEGYAKKTDKKEQTSYAKDAVHKLLHAIEQSKLRKNTNARQKDFFLESTANNILQNEDIACVGLSTIVHDFLQDM